MTDYDNQDQELRIAAIFGQAMPPGVRPKTLKVMLAHLRQSLIPPVILTGAMDFEWEEYFVRGGGRQEMYALLRKDRPSHKDTFELINLPEKFAEEGIIASVKRMEDGKVFEIPLVDMKVADEGSPNAMLLDDYAAWMVNYG